MLKHDMTKAMTAQITVLVRSIHAVQIRQRHGSHFIVEEVGDPVSITETGVD